MPAVASLFPKNSSAHRINVDSAEPIVLFDASHGQPNWGQTGFPSREMHTNFAGLMEILCRLGCRCVSSEKSTLPDLLPKSRLLVVPPPAGRYDALKQRWRQTDASLFSAAEISHVLSYLYNGGSLLAFAYRFGDAFTQANLADLFGALKCQLNDDAVLDISALRATHPLKMQFATTRDMLPTGWSREAVAQVHWRPMASLTIMPGACAQPLALSAGGRCLSFNRTLREISFESLPIAVAGSFGKGRYALFGGPHVFETGPFGLLNDGDNARYLMNILRWLLNDGTDDSAFAQPFAPSQHYGFGRELSRVICRGDGEDLIEDVERILKRTGVLKALSRAKWLP